MILYYYQEEGEKMRGKLTRREAADFLNIPLRTLDFLIRRGEIPFSRIGRRSVRFDLERLEEWFREREGLEYRIRSGQRLPFAPQKDEGNIGKSVESKVNDELDGDGMMK
jgi:excisionase family DNA binding protein